MRLALAGQAYSGKTTLAHTLVARGFALVDFTGFIKRTASEAIFYSTGVVLSPNEINAHKNDYRAFLQGFAQIGGFNDGNGVLEALREVGNETSLPEHIVFDNIRTQAQFDILRPHGFVLATVHAPLAVRAKRASLAGVSEENFAALNVHHTEQPPTGPLALDGTRSEDELADALLALLGIYQASLATEEVAALETATEINLEKRISTSQTR